MAASANALRAGIFIVVSTLVALAVVIVVSDLERFAPKKKYIAVFTISEDIQGVKPGDEVRLGGLRVGAVRDVQFDDSGAEPLVKVTISLPTKYRLKQGASASVGGIIGGVWVNIDSLGSGPELGELGQLDGTGGLISRLNRIAPDIERVVAEIETKIIPKAESTMEEYRLLAADARSQALPKATATLARSEEAATLVRDEVRKILDQYYAVTEQARAAAKNIGDFIGPGTDKPAGDFRSTMSNLAETTATARKELPEITERVKKILDQVNDRLPALRETIQDLRTAMTDTKEITASVRSVLTENRSRIDRIIAGVESTTENAEGFTAEVLRRPSRLIWRDDGRTSGNIDAYHTAREFAEGAQGLNDAASSLRDALKDPRITEEEIRRRLAVLDSRFEAFNAVEKKLYDSIKTK
jgi:ABC-type transporter Mla subunit MlaD